MVVSLAWLQAIFFKKFIQNFKPIEKKFNVDTCVIPLGGDKSFWSHLKYITLPNLFRNKAFKWPDQKNIEEKILKNIDEETKCHYKNSVFWAFIISSNKIKTKENLIKSHLQINSKANLYTFYY